jgi:hypothetical protein
MNSFNTQLQIEDMYDQDEDLALSQAWSNESDDYAALLHYCESRDENRDAQELHWENVWMDINNEYQSNQPSPF